MSVEIYKCPVEAGPKEFYGPGFCPCGERLVLVERFTTPKSNVVNLHERISEMERKLDPTYFSWVCPMGRSLLELSRLDNSDAWLVGIALAQTDPIHTITMLNEDLAKLRDFLNSALPNP